MGLHGDWSGNSSSSLQSFHVNIAWRDCEQVLRLLSSRGVSWSVDWCYCNSWRLDLIRSWKNFSRAWILVFIEDNQILIGSNRRLGIIFSDTIPTLFSFIWAFSCWLLSLIPIITNELLQNFVKVVERIQICVAIGSVAYRSGIRLNKTIGASISVIN